MLLRVCRVAYKNVDTLFANVTRSYARAVVNAWRNISDNETVDDNKGIIVIKSKKRIYDFYIGDTHDNKKQSLASHGWKNRKSKGDYFFIYPYKDVDRNQDRGVGLRTFQDLNLSPRVCDQLANFDIQEPVEIQRLGIPKILQGHNVLLAAETGCGKTLAYLLPLITKVLEWKQAVQRTINCPLGLIVTPSRELTVQIALELIKLSKSLDIKIKIITGGRTKKILSDPPAGQVDILVCSFGVISKLTTFNVYSLKFVRFVVLDEADSLLHYTFQDKLQVFMKRIYVESNEVKHRNEFPEMAQLVLASATIPSRLKNVLGSIVNPDSIAHVTTKKLHGILVPQKFIRLIPSEKPVELLRYVKPKALSKQRVIVFSNHNGTSNWLSLFLHECGVRTTNLNGDMPLHVRRGKYGEFLNGKTTVLSTTNGGSRGLDTLQVNHILNYDFPLDTAAYIHRCGRTGRIGSVGDCRVTNFICKPGEVAVVQKIEMAARRLKPIPIFNLVESNDEEEDEVEEGGNDYERIIENIDEAENIPY